MILFIILMKTIYGQFFLRNPEVNYLLTEPSFIAVRSMTGYSFFKEGRDLHFLDYINLFEVQHLIQSFSYGAKFIHD